MSALEHDRDAHAAYGGTTRSLSSLGTRALLSEPQAHRIASQRRSEYRRPRYEARSPALHSNKQVAAAIRTAKLLGFQGSCDLGHAWPALIPPCTFATAPWLLPEPSLVRIHRQEALRTVHDTPCTAPSSPTCISKTKTCTRHHRFQSIFIAKLKGKLRSGHVRRLLARTALQPALA